MYPNPFDRKHSTIRQVLDRIFKDKNGQKHVLSRKNSNTSSCSNTSHTESRKMFGLSLRWDWHCVNCNRVCLNVLQFSCNRLTFTTWIFGEYYSCLSLVYFSITKCFIFTLFHYNRQSIHEEIYFKIVDNFVTNFKKILCRQTDLLNKHT